MHPADPAGVKRVGRLGAHLHCSEHSICQAKRAHTCLICLANHGRRQGVLRARGAQGAHLQARPQAVGQFLKAVCENIPNLENALKTCILIKSKRKIIEIR